MDGECSMCVADETCIPNFSRIPKGKIPLATHRHRREGNVKLDLKIKDFAGTHYSPGSVRGHNFL